LHFVIGAVQLSAEFAVSDHCRLGWRLTIDRGEMHRAFLKRLAVERNDAADSGQMGAAAAGEQAIEQEETEATEEIKNLRSVLMSSALCYLCFLLFNPSHANPT
jgi:hypothetical protein